MTIYTALLLALTSFEWSKADEYCLLESFEPSCPPDSVILMTSSRYGRMRIGRCLTREYYLGCSVDALTYMDQACSGKRRCKVSIPQPDLIQAMPCPKDLVAYLDAEYQCVKVSSEVFRSKIDDVDGNEDKISPVTSASCLGQSAQTISFQRTKGANNDDEKRMLTWTGYLLSDYTRRTDIGSLRCPLTIVAQPGQFINISLIDLSELRSAVNVSGGLDAASRTSRNSNQVVCTESYAVINESEFNGLATTSSTTVCRPTTRRSNVYNTTTTRVTIALNTELAKTSRFILVYTEASLDYDDVRPQSGDLITSYEYTGAGGLYAAVFLGIVVGFLFGILLLFMGHCVVQYRYGVYDDDGDDFEPSSATNACTSHQQQAAKCSCDCPTIVGSHCSVRTPPSATQCDYAPPGSLQCVSIEHSTFDQTYRCIVRPLVDDMTSPVTNITRSNFRISNSWSKEKRQGKSVANSTLCCTGQSDSSEGDMHV